ncbi:NAD(P)H-dependent FMN reductase [Natronospira proteinivora]|uniref:NAD(P)H-dependent FMN reductase n=1 Tax=Natronospira proteinivora TaxID=1807133 RepID=A0ABT1G6N2_9GAMM|nr:NADPH-dependent FMN reductase [Natronospira proteinivora]MCP1726610.1 NAD(P)H-dependent FMN reductase [Natronospira proteinivora]
MSEAIKLLTLAGSLRRASVNRRLQRVVSQAARDQGAQVTELDLADYPLPVYDGDLEQAEFPENVRKLQSLLAEHDAVLISSPEYNGSIPGMLKNVIDWLSRPQEDGTPGTALFKGKVIGISAASPGRLGGLRCLLILRDALAKLGSWVAPTQVAVGGAGDAFEADAPRLSNDKQQKQIEGLVREVLDASGALRPS